MKLIVSRRITTTLYRALERVEAMTSLLHSHARGETDLTEDQLANVVTGVTTEATEALRLARATDIARMPPAPTVLPRAASPGVH